MSGKTLPEWPDEADYISIEPPDGHEAGRDDYERARANAAMVRLRVAVEALRDAHVHMHLSGCSWCMAISGVVHCSGRVEAALSAIGDLPPETP